MNNNDILRRLRFAFSLSDRAAVALFSANPGSVAKMTKQGYLARLAKENEAQFVTCTDAELAAFLDGLIVAKRGMREPAPKLTIIPADYRLSKNDILKKLRIMMRYRDDEMLATLAKGGTRLSKSELSAFFRNPDHKHYRTCGNQIIRNFIKGLTQTLRDDTQ